MEGISPESTLKVDIFPYTLTTPWYKLNLYPMITTILKNNFQEDLTKRHYGFESRQILIRKDVISSKINIFTG